MGCMLLSYLVIQAWMPRVIWQVPYTARPLKCCFQRLLSRVVGDYEICLDHVIFGFNW